MGPLGQIQVSPHDFPTSDLSRLQLSAPDKRMNAPIVLPEGLPRKNVDK